MARRAVVVASAAAAATAVAGAVAAAVVLRDADARHHFERRVRIMRLTARRGGHFVVKRLKGRG
ncbi:MAG TPA: hypothetical protein VFO65_10720, partial [Acidimicrobiales bacterium]|nr:hypothetical protein [Acidimicrobiales bacterium]